MMEEAKKRDHRESLARSWDSFMFAEEGPGFPFFLPKGMVLKNTLLEYWHEIHLREGYQEISTPVILSRKLWETSGHWDHYKANMYTTVIDEEDYAIKPMNCPGGMLVYKSQPRSYRDLPLRLGELGLVHRHEKSGQLHGLMRVRCFTQDDAHIYMTQEQITDEIQGGYPPDSMRYISSLASSILWSCPPDRRIPWDPMRIGRWLPTVLKMPWRRWALTIL